MINRCSILIIILITDIIVIKKSVLLYIKYRLKCTSIIFLLISFITIDRFWNFFLFIYSGNSIISSLNLIVIIMIIKNFSLNHDQISSFPSVSITVILIISLQGESLFCKSNIPFTPTIYLYRDIYLLVSPKVQKK